MRRAFSFFKMKQVLEDVVEYEQTSDGLVKTTLDRILLNGSYVCMLVPGSEGPEHDMPLSSSA